jgi:muramidase (phage lysozyme)
MNQNLKAFLDMIAYSEGTDNGRQPTKDHGYDVVVGGGLFEGYADHPRKVVNIRPGLASTAAGRYQVLARYFDTYKKQLGLPDFSSESQDAIAIQLIKECGAMRDIEAGYIDIAISKCASRWASLPGAGYKQHENEMGKLVAAYKKAGGWVA